MNIEFYLYLILNCIIFYSYYKKEDGIFQAPFLMAYTSIFVLLPQLSQIYLLEYYNQISLNLFIYVISTCNLTFVAGFEISKYKYISSHYTYIKFNKIKRLLYVFIVIGLYSIFTWSDTYQGGDNVIQSYLRSFASYAFCLLAPFLVKKNTPRRFFILACLCIIPIAYFAFFVKGSRGATLFLILSISFIASLKYPYKKAQIKKLGLILLIIGAIANASISIIRHVLVGNPATGEKVSTSELSLITAYEKSFSNTEAGFNTDLGNAAIGIDVLSKSFEMDYGITYIWDNFIQNYIPRRIVGEDVKESLKLKLVNDQKLTEYLTNGTTTMTGYYYAYRSFNMFAPILFLLIGMLIGYIWIKIKNSMLHFFIYLVVLANVPLFLTHGPGYIYSGLEFIFIFIYPFIYGGITKSKINK